MVLPFGDSDRPIALPGPLWSEIILTNYSYVDLLTVGPKFTRPYVCCGYALLQSIDGTDGRTDEHSTVNRIYYADREKKPGQRHSLLTEVTAFRIAVNYCSSHVA